ncbi:phage holin family protein [Variovorax sp. KK3]|uniref:phage holin family protein n=1 Tax=Variovorax sp. KK3 TaxID=1855728 RepID=UPI00097C29F3|nr:phage holin family protein [Variovorax sp. KK3]
MHPIYKTVLRRPDLLFTHVANYAELVKAEAGSFGTSIVVRAASAAVAVVALVLALALTAMALMLGFVHGRFEWVLVIVPGVAWLIVPLGAAIAMRSTVKEKVEEVKHEVETDLRVLRLVREANDEAY